MIPEENLLTWFRPDTEVFEAAAKEKMPIVLFFSEEDVDPIEATRQLHDADLAKMSDDNVMFVLITYNGDRTPSFSDGSPIPTSKLLSPNPSRDYNITRYPSYVVCDWFGNEYERHTKTPSARDLKKQLEGVTESMNSTTSKLQSTLEAAQKALEGKDLRKFFSEANKNFRTGVIGLEPAEETIKLYRGVIDDARKEIDDMLEQRPADAESRLKEMNKVYKDTELATAIKDAQSIIKGR